MEDLFQNKDRESATSLPNSARTIILRWKSNRRKQG
jgi:hypothetical protein